MRCFRSWLSLGSKRGSYSVSCPLLRAIVISSVESPRLFGACSPINSSRYSRASAASRSKAASRTSSSCSASSGTRPVASESRYVSRCCRGHAIRSWSSSEVTKVSSCAGEAAEFARVKIWWSTELAITSWRAAAFLLYIDDLLNDPTTDSDVTGTHLIDTYSIHIAPLWWELSIYYVERPARPELSRLPRSSVRH